METTIKSNQAKNFVQAEKRAEKATATAKANLDFWQQMESMRFGIIPMQLFILGCVSGIAAAFGAQADTLKLALVAFPTIIALALTLAVSPMRVIIWASVTAIILDLIVLFI
ncbi:MAG: hypothetical protein WCH21_04155 [Bacteroidota bacterium]